MQSLQLGGEWGLESDSGLVQALQQEGSERTVTCRLRGLTRPQEAENAVLSVLSLLARRACQDCFRCLARAGTS